MANRFSRDKSSNKGPSQRQLRAGELIRHELVEILRREPLRDEALSGQSITVSEVRASPDLRQATVFCTVLGGATLDAGGQGVGEQGAGSKTRAGYGADIDAVVKALNTAAPHLRHLLGQRLEMKFTPALTFKNDGSFAEARKIDDLLARPDVRRDLSDGDA